MLLKRFVEYANRRNDLPPIGYDKRPVRWMIDLNGKRKVQPRFVLTTGSVERNERGKFYFVPHRERTSTAVRPKLLADNAENTFGIAKREGGEKHAAKCRNAYLALLEECALETKEAAVMTVCKYLKSWDLKEWKLPKDFGHEDIFTFRVDGELLIDNPAIKGFWAKKFWSFSLEESGYQEDAESIEILPHEVECHICGIKCTPVPRHPFKIKGVPRGQGKIVSANKEAFFSYGLKYSLIAPTCKGCVEKYIKAANVLINAGETSIRIPPLVYLFWTKEARDFSPVSFLSNPHPEEVKALIKSAWRGREYSSIDEDAFYSTALSLKKARIVVRDWVETTVGEVRKNMRRWFLLQRLVDHDGSEGRPLGLFQLAACVVRDAEEIPPNVPRVLLHAALKGGPLPKWLLYQAVRRNGAEQRLTRPRAALIKMVLLSGNKKLREGEMERLDTTINSPAYLCGRLLAVIEAIQATAIPGAGATVVDRFFGTASSAPASVFGHLLRGSQAHLGKIRKEKGGYYHALQQRLEGILSSMEGFPTTLTLEEQGLFCLGYYHQKAHDRAGARAHSKSKKHRKAEKEEDNE